MSALVTVCERRGKTDVPVARLFVASPSEPTCLGPVLSEVVAEVPRRPARVGDWGPHEDLPGRIVLGLWKKLSKSERCLPVPVTLDSVGERWRYTLSASRWVTSWMIEEPATLMCWSGSHREFDDRCKTFGSVFW